MSLIKNGELTMNTRFRYDYNFKMLAINIVLTSLFFIIFAISYDKGVIAFCLFGLASIFSLFNIQTKKLNSLNMDLLTVISMKEYS